MNNESVSSILHGMNITESVILQLYIVKQNMYYFEIKDISKSSHNAHSKLKVQQDGMKSYVYKDNLYYMQVSIVITIVQTAFW